MNYNITFTGNENLDLIIFISILVWSLIWKGIALWISSKQNAKIWFVALLVINTLGILEILYIFIFSKTKKNSLSSENSTGSTDSSNSIASDNNSANISN
ncbi:MAG TPA: DUF5652 family protein [Candidatus Paceibacterota bacterium]|nr:DUF5652 family protein [Candidatus Paceibacterota bacterium]